MSIIKRVAQEMLEQDRIAMESGQLKVPRIGQEEIKPDSEFAKIFGNVFSGINLSDEGENETEYSYFVYLNPEQMKQLIDKFGSGDTSAFIECKIPCGNKERKVRARQYYNGSEVERSELTTKIQTGEKKKREYNSEISRENFLSLAWGSTSVTSRVRIFIPLLDRDGKQIPRRGHGFYRWEVDLYFSPQVDGFHPWAKVELEVTNAALQDDDIVSKIPFEYDELILSDTGDKKHRDLITSLYNEQYNMIANDMSFLDGKA